MDKVGTQTRNTQTSTYILLTDNRKLFGKSRYTCYAFILIYKPIANTNNACVPSDMCARAIERACVHAYGGRVNAFMRLRETASILRPSKHYTY